MLALSSINHMKVAQIFSVAHRHIKKGTMAHKGKEEFTHTCFFLSLLYNRKYFFSTYCKNKVESIKYVLKNFK